LVGVYDVTVSVGDVVSQGDTLGVTGVSRLEVESANVVHLEVYKNGELVNPESLIGEDF